MWLGARREFARGRFTAKFVKSSPTSCRELIESSPKGCWEFIRSSLTKIESSLRVHRKDTRTSPGIRREIN
ncbi:hypothetical protein GW17_00023232 [Ensete ventricosum]|nr:hypothetical protein GW17_00023232 [Ensete ventricosum]